MRLNIPCCWHCQWRLDSDDTGRYTIRLRVKLNMSIKFRPGPNNLRMVLARAII